jgi:hypothetical protein
MFSLSPAASIAVSSHSRAFPGSTAPGKAPYKHPVPHGTGCLYGASQVDSLYNMKETISVSPRPRTVSLTLVFVQLLRKPHLRASLRFLMHGLVFQTLDERRVTIRPHLLRHGFATWALNVAKEPVDIVARILNQSNLDSTKFYGRPNPRQIAERSHGLMHQISSYIDVGDLVLRSPEELRELLKKAQKTHGTLARTRGGRCLLCGECPILFACIGCSAKVPDPAQRDEVEEVQQITLLQIERAKKKGLALEVAQHQKKLKQCDAELREMDMIEACRADELREPEVSFDVEA